MPYETLFSGHETEYAASSTYAEFQLMRQLFHSYNPLELFKIKSSSYNFQSFRWKAFKNIPMNIYSKSKDWRERILSNFASTPFTIQIGSETFQCSSVEGLWQGLKCKGDMRLHVFGLSGMKAKMAGKGKKTKIISIGGLEFGYGSAEHEQIIREGIKQKILQNEKAATALRESKGKVTHHVPGSSKPVFKMENLLMSVRAELFGQ